MRITFIPGQCLPFHAKTLDTRPLGGTETGIIRLADALQARGHDVTVLSENPNPPPSYPLYVPLSAMQFLPEQDIVIGIRDWKTILYPVNTKRRFFWTGDAYDQPQTVGLGDRRIISQIDKFLAVSEWQKTTLCNSSGFPLEKASVIKNGIVTNFFDGTETRIRKRLIYSSTPYRGLKFLPAIFKEIRKKHPDAELHVFSGYDVYGGASSQPKVMIDEFNALSAELTAVGAVMRGNVTQKVLAREFMKGAILAYPNIFAETSCITAMEAQAGGCVVVSTNLGALSETVEDRGILIDGAPPSLDYMKSFLSSLDSLLTNDVEFANLSERSRNHALANFSWEKVAERIESL